MTSIYPHLSKRAAGGRPLLRELESHVRLKQCEKWATISKAGRSKALTRVYMDLDRGSPSTVGHGPRPSLTSVKR